MSESPPKRGRGRPRREGADEAILDIVRDVLAQEGYAKLNVDDVAERAGVAKTTIYRRWPSKSALAAAVLPAVDPDATADALLRESERLLRQFAGSEDGEVLGILRAVVAPRRDALARALHDEQRADEILGALWMRLFVTSR